MVAYVPLPGSKRILMANSRAAGPIDPTEIASLTVRIRSEGDPQALLRKRTNWPTRRWRRENI